MDFVVGVPFVLIVSSLVSCYSCSFGYCVANMNPAEGDTARTMPAGRARGQPNFRIKEDTMLASSYVVVTTNAAAGTGQNGATFWGKVNTNFVQRGGSGSMRSAVSLANRFNKVLQGKVNKYIGLLQGTLCEYHSGWSLPDYVDEGKRKFVVKFSKPFKHENVYNILSKSLPKYQLNLEMIDGRVRRALFFVDNELNAAGTVVGGSDGSGDEGGSAVAPVGPIPAIVCTPRPTVGKKKAKTNAYLRKQQMLEPAAKNPEVELANAEAVTMHLNSLTSEGGFC